MRDLEKSASVFRACRAFEDVMGLGHLVSPPRPDLPGQDLPHQDLPSQDPLTYFKIIHRGGPAPAPGTPPSDKDRWVFETHDDLRLTGNGSSAIPETWAPGQSFAYEMHVYEDSVWLQDAHQDTMFIRMQDYAVQSLGGLLYLLYGARVKSQLHALLRARDPEPKMPEWRAGGDKDAYLARTRVWLQKRQAYKARQPSFGTVPSARDKLALNARIHETLRDTPEICAAQMALWGEPDPAPALWFEITKKGAK